jgi:hypothetical protein
MLLGPPGSESNTVGFSHPDHGDDWRLWNLATLISPPNQDYSRIYEHHAELIDHILVSRALAAPDHITITVHRQGAASTGPDPRDRTGEPASDHDPVIAQLTAP